MQRPLGIVLVAIALIVTGVIGTLGGFVLLAVPTAQLQLIGFLVVAAGILSFAAAYGLWTFQSWGWGLSLVLQIASLPLTFVVLAMPPPFGGSGLGPADILGIAVTVVIIVYLLLPRVRALYGSRAVA
jgi:uncharacterized membrane protein (DUF2068 family)